MTGYYPGFTVERRPRYRWRTWMRGHVPVFLVPLFPKGKHDCGEHEWYVHWRSEDGQFVSESCYHCTEGLRTRDTASALTPRVAVTAAHVENAVSGLRDMGLLGDTEPRKDGSRSAGAWKACIYEDTGIVRYSIDEIEKYPGEVDVTAKIAVALKEARRLQSDLYRYAREVHGIDREAIDKVRL